MDEHMIYVDRYKLGACLVPKCMSTIITGVLCYLNDDVAFTKANRNITTESYVDRFCGDEIDSRDVVQWSMDHNSNNEYTVLTFVRDPIERFLSAFVDKCDVEQSHPEVWRRLDCYGCVRDVDCFIRELERRLWLNVDGRKHHLTVMDVHVVPQTWHCSMERYLSTYRVFRQVSTKSPEYKVFLDEFRFILEERQVPEKQIAYVMNELNQGHTHHTTSNSVLRKKYLEEIQSKPDLMKILIELYYYDYITFGLPMPQI
ncbi:unnamed protein product [Bursaphelenchus okinawaensis]|uniref:Carbohydrate sulfotransferase n=1 Tax=Bursaphelenchus okinawaensis TaxID=465554 RepID=A0A811KXV0_9BILA|nr:unnamed protein product [Bursaphelenchus okinawaensis]CAG9115175.1 unnamed protein product [Bursaphelenchus okinawaensis]